MCPFRHCEHAQTWWEGHHDLRVMLLPRLCWCWTGASSTVPFMTLKFPKTKAVALIYNAKSNKWLKPGPLLGWDSCQPYLQSAGRQPREWETDGGVWEAGKWGEKPNTQTFPCFHRCDSSQMFVIDTIEVIERWTFVAKDTDVWAYHIILVVKRMWSYGILHWRWQKNQGKVTGQWCGKKEV